jgi:peptide/nickel transport system substrate-binding protein
LFAICGERIAIGKGKAPAKNRQTNEVDCVKEYFMNLKRLTTLYFILLIFVGLFSGVAAQDMTYSEAPMLAERVAAGELPPVSERLPANPKVVQVVDQIGTYGGTMRFADTGERMDEGLRIRHTGLFRYNFTASEYQADLAETWEWSNENRTLTITLRDGLKWSDGDDFTTEDILWFWENVLNDPDISPNGPGGFWSPTGEPAVLEVVDDTTFSWTWPIPYPIAMDSFGRTHFSGDNSLYGPSHYLQQFHARFNENAQALAEGEGFETWVDLLNARRAQGYLLISMPLDRPYLDSWVPVVIQSDRVLLERNPYFHQVDPEGNQLPYMDYIEVTLAGDQDIYALRLSAGELDFGVRWTRPSDLQLYRQNEESGDYKMYIARALRPSDFAIFLNQTFPDQELQPLFRTLDFRAALSMGIDRNEMNDVLFFGLGEVHPPTPINTLPWFRQEWYNEYLEYKPDRSNELLDGLGLDERDSEGFRLLPDGRRLTIIIHGRDIHMPGCEMISSDYRDIGVELICQESTPDLIDQLQDDNQMMAQIWHIDRSTLFGRGTPDDFAINDPSRHSWGRQWALWISSNGQAGIEPPQEIKDLNAKWNEFSKYPSDSPEAAEIGAEYFSYYAEQLPIISSIGLSPQPVIYSNRMRNVPTEGLFWSSDTNFYSPFHVEQWYIEDAS